MTAIARYMAALNERLAAVDVHQIERVGELIAEQIRLGNVIHVFGSGHSQLVAMEVAARAGGLASVHAIIDPALAPGLPDRAGLTERLSGYAHVTGQLCDLRAGELLIVFSNSGINPVPIEFADLAKHLGLTVIAVTSRNASEHAVSRDASGRRLLDVADLVLDTGTPVGDTTLLAAGHPTGPVSTILAAAVFHAAVARAVEIVGEEGIEPPLLMSLNSGSNETANADVSARFAARMRLR